MFSRRVRTLFMVIAGSVAVSGCAYDDYGYGGMSVGVGSGYYDPWYDDYAGYGYNRYGWYDGFYYPGNGYYIYDRDGRRQRWNDKHRRYWEARRHAYRDRDRDRGRPDRWRDRDDRRGGEYRPGRDNNGRWERMTPAQRDAWRAARERRQDARPGRGDGPRWGRPGDRSQRDRWQGSRPSRGDANVGRSRPERSSVSQPRSRPERPSVSQPRGGRESGSGIRGGRSGREPGNRHRRPD